jgi:hypothetical protein
MNASIGQVGRRIPGSPTRGVLTIAALIAAGACAGDGNVDVIAVTTVPTPPAYVSGGETLVRIEVAPGVDVAQVAVSVAGRPADAVAPAPPDRLGRPGSALLALVSGLALGDNEIEVEGDGRRAASLTVTNYPLEGPIFSGALLEPYFCLGDLASTNGRRARVAIG